MNRTGLTWILLTGLLAGCVSGPAPVDATATLQRMQWLVGTWQRADLPAGHRGHERWFRNDAGFSGEGVSMQGGATTFEERLRIEVRGGEVVYIADVAHNPAPVVFRLTRIDDDGFVFENPARLPAGDRLSPRWRRPAGAAVGRRRGARVPFPPFAVAHA